MLGILCLVFLAGPGILAMMISSQDMWMPPITSVLWLGFWYLVRLGWMVWSWFSLGFCLFPSGGSFGIASNHYLLYRLRIYVFLSWWEIINPSRSLVTFGCGALVTFGCRALVVATSDCDAASFGAIVVLGSFSRNFLCPLI